MFKHEKQLFHPVAVERPNPQYAALLQEQLGGGNGELKAAMQYLSQSFRIKDQKIKDLFLDIAAEELGHMEMEMCIRDRLMVGLEAQRQDHGVSRQLLFALLAADDCCLLYTSPR